MIQFQVSRIAVRPTGSSFSFYYYQLTCTNLIYMQREVHKTHRTSNRGGVLGR